MDAIGIVSELAELPIGAKFKLAQLDGIPRIADTKSVIIKPTTVYVKMAHVTVKGPIRSDKVPCKSLDGRFTTHIRPDRLVVIVR